MSIFKLIFTVTVFVFVEIHPSHSGTMPIFTSLFGKREVKCIAKVVTSKEKCNLAEEFYLTVRDTITRYAHPQYQNYLGCIGDAINGQEYWRQSECRETCVKKRMNITELKSCDLAMNDSDFDDYTRKLNVTVHNAQFAKALSESGVKASDACEQLQKFNRNSDAKSNEEYLKVYNAVVKIIVVNTHSHSSSKIEDAVVQCMHDFNDYVKKYYFKQ